MTATTKGTNKKVKATSSVKKTSAKKSVSKSSPEKTEELSKEATPQVSVSETTEAINVATDKTNNVESQVETVDEDIETSKAIVDGFNQLIEFHKQQRALQTAEITRIRAMKSQYERQFKSIHKKIVKRRKKKCGDSENNGFKRPTKISNELCDFFGKPHGTLMARTDVTKELSIYIREHKLQDPKNGRNIIPDLKLRKLLRIGKTDELNIFNMQTYMVPHYPKTITQQAVSQASA